MNDKALNAVVLQVDRLTFSYPGRHVFTEWSHGFRPGLTWLRGSNGSGKSTLLKLLVGALTPLGGRLTVRGIEQAAAPLDYKRQVFWCGPGAFAFDHLRPPEVFAFLRSLYPLFDAAGAQVLATELGLAPFMAKPLSALSTGTQRKVWLVAALHAGTAVVLLDEPLAALDQASLRTVRARLARCAADTQTAWVVVSHDALGAAEAGALQLDLDALLNPCA